MKKHSWVLLSGILFLSAGFARAEESTKKFFAQMEVWSVDDAYQADEEAADVWINDPSTPYLEKKIEISGGAGIRFGMLVPTSVTGLDWGGSLGYISGPEGDFDVNDGAPITEQIKSNDKTNFLRLMFEVKKNIPLSKSVDLRLGAALGVANARIKSDGTTMGTYVGNGSWSESDSWNGVSWEVSPSIRIKMRTVNVDLGVMYSAFPKLKETEKFNEFKWTPIGFKAGVEF